jgi:hypothetical protein
MLFFFLNYDLSRNCNPVYRKFEVCPFVKRWVAVLCIIYELEPCHCIQRTLGTKTLIGVHRKVSREIGLGIHDTKP